MSSRSRSGPIGKFEDPLFLRHAGVEDDLQQKVAELFAPDRGDRPGDRIGDLIGLLDRIGGDGREILLQSHGQPVPGVRSAAMISRSRASSQDGVISLEAFMSPEAFMAISRWARRRATTPAPASEGQAAPWDVRPRLFHPSKMPMADRPGHGKNDGVGSVA